jgi:hypothetical protein
MQRLCEPSKHICFKSANEQPRNQFQTHSEPTQPQADFTYKITPKLISIVDTGLGQRSVTDDIEAVLRKIEHWHQGLISSFKIMPGRQSILASCSVGRQNRVSFCLEGDRRAKSARAGS